MTIQRTLSIIKPDATSRNIIGKIIDRFESNNLKVIAGEIPAMKNLTDIEPKLLPNKNNDD